MSTKAIAGYKGGLYVKSGSTASKIAEITEATLTIEQSEIDVTSFDSDGWVENIGGLKNWSVDAEANYRADDANGQTALYSALVGSTASVIELYPNDTSSALGYTGSVIVTSFEIGSPVDDKISLSLSMVGTGALHTASKS